MPFDLAEEWILAAEARLGARLPAAYRAAMLRRNGGSIEADGEEWELYPIRDGSDRKRLARTCNDILSETAACREWRGFPPLALAIGGDGSGDRLVFLRAGEAYGAAPARWRHETGELTDLAAGFGDPTSFQGA